MTLRRRIALAGAAAALVAVVLACGAAWIAVRAELHGQIDDQLRTQGAALERFGERLERASPEMRPPMVRAGDLSPEEGGPLAYAQALTPAGRVRERFSVGSFRLPVDATDRAVASGARGAVLRDVGEGDRRLRLLTVPVAGFGAVQLGRPLEPTDRVLARLRLVLAGVVLGGVLLAALLGRAATRRVTAPLRDVADAAGHIATTEDLGRRIAVTSEDEVGRLARRFNLMLDRLEASREALAGSVAAQRQLVADASHELRTPVTSLRTNLEVLLLDGAGLDDASRRQLTTDLLAQTEELGALVTDVIELARGDAVPAELEDVRLDAIVVDAVERARRHHRSVTFEVTAEPAVLDGAADRLGRAIGNLLSNAAKHAPPGSVVEVAAGAGGVTVRDHGPGVAEEDLPHLFDRFYRGATSRALPGTGLGLAIVRQVAEAHGGSVRAESAPGGGARFTLELPARAVVELATAARS